MTINFKQLFLSLSVLVTLAAAQQTGRQLVMSPPTDSTNLPMQKIGPDDLIGITVYDAPELTRTARVATDGTIRLPMLKQRIKIAGLFPSDVETAISDALKAEDIFVDPIVTVSIVEYRSRPINVVGAVKAPVTFQAFGNVTLLDALSRAGGLADYAGSEILVSQSQPGEQGKSVLLTRRIAVKGLIDQADPELNIKLEGGEEIRIPDAGKIYVVGNVKKPGAFPIRDTAESSVLKSLALSEGLMPYALKTAYIYRREAGSGGNSEIQVDLEKIMQRKVPDVPLLANDILYIPDNKGRRNLASVMEKVVAIGGGAAVATIYLAR